jgi:hypothetical protein
MCEQLRIGCREDGTGRLDGPGHVKKAAADSSGRPMSTAISAGFARRTGS